MPSCHQPQLLYGEAACTMQEILTEAMRLSKRPQILELIDADLDEASREKKKERLANAEWERARLLGEEVEELKSSSRREPQLAGGGRPRTPAAIVLAALSIRGWYGSLTSASVRDRLADSTNFKALLWRYGLDHVEATVLARHVNNLSEETVERIWAEYLSLCREEGLGDFATFSADSTSVRANAQWPNDSSLIYKLLRRAVGTLVRIQKVVGASVPTGWINNWLEKLRTTSRDVDLASGKGAKRKRRKLYAKIVETGRKLAVRLGQRWDDLASEAEVVDLRPTDARLLAAAINDFEDCVADALTLIDFAEARTQIDPESEREPHEKITGVVERDAAIIKKGGREPNFGFKPQFGFSGDGLVTSIIVDAGNVSDSASLLPLLEQSISRTAVTPAVVTVDDGYASKRNFTVATKKHDLDVMSISGSKGRKIIGDEHYDSQAWRDARNVRAKLEFPFFVLKRVQEMDRMKRTGLKAVRREIVEKAIAFNLSRAVALRKAAARAESEQLALTG